jgi:uncharacterized protein YjiS (DUF1127 family)
MTRNAQTLGSLIASAAAPRGSPLVRAADTFLAWLERARVRRALATMSDFQLKDVGLSRADIQGEVDKPFWRR